MLFKVGELAKRTGLTVRALHHYDAIGLLVPSARSASGYRLYNGADIARLHCIQALRQLGLPLAEIGAMLSGNGTPLPVIIAQQIVALDHQIAQAGELRVRLTQLKEQLATGSASNLTEWLTTLELMTLYGKYFTPEELTLLRRNRKEVESDWLLLTGDVAAAMKCDWASATPEAQTLALRWIDLLARTLGPDHSLWLRWGEMHDQEPTLQVSSGVSPAMMEYIKRLIDVHLALLLKYLTLAEIQRLDSGKYREWAALVAHSRQLLEQNVAADHSKAQNLIRAWDELLDETAAHDPLLCEKFLHALQSEPLLRPAVDAALLDYLRRIRANLSELVEPG